jgi:tRNA threonylcarbamoyl adenosine modification protein (Sua5/YciO/YrdC/YwlC family)
LSISKLVHIHPKNPQARFIAEAARVLGGGGVIIYPTDTIYGLGAAISKKQAVERIIALKGRDPKKPMSIVCADLSHISEYALVSNVAYRILRRFLPGPYTFVLPATAKLPKTLVSRQKTIGIRIPNHAVPLALVRALGEPLLSTSANKSGEDAISDPDVLKCQFGSQVDCILACDILSGEASSVISLVDDEIRILRAGAGDLAYFEKVKALAIAE